VQVGAAQPRHQQSNADVEKGSLTRRKEAAWHEGGERDKGTSREPISRAHREHLNVAMGI